jgi:microcystin degradation protein MlrC
MDAADATSSGASGDSNAILRQLVESGYTGQALLPIVDPPAVAAAFAAGVGGTVRTTIGGALDSARFQPLPIEVRVRLLADGQFRSESFGSHWNSGNTAVLQAGNITLVVGSRPVSLFDRAFFLAHGQDPRRFDLVVVKSPHCEPHMLAQWCGRLINVDAPGSTSANVRSLGHTKCIRPIFPLDEGVTFSPRADIFQRGH